MKIELAKNRKDGELLVVEVGLRMQHQEASEECSAELLAMNDKMIKAGETKNRRQKAEAAAFLAIDEKTAAQKALADEINEQKNREREIKKFHETKLQEAKNEANAQLSNFTETLEAEEKRRIEMEKIMKKLETKASLWKSMADFLQRDLERVKVHSMQIENTWERAKEDHLKQGEIERTNTE